MSHQFGVRLRSLRQHWGLHQRDVELALNLGQGSCSQYERNLREPGYDLLIAMADFFDASVDYMLGRPEAAWESAALLAARRRLAAPVEENRLGGAEPSHGGGEVLKLAMQAAPDMFSAERLARRLKVDRATLLAAAEGIRPAPRQLAVRLAEHLGIPLTDGASDR